MESLPSHGSCFVCGNSNPQSIGIVWQKNPNGRIESTFAFNIHQQGPPGLVHGGASAAVLDEAMGAAVWQEGFRAATVHLELDYRKPIPIGEIIRIEGWLFLEKIDSITARGIIYRSDGTIAVIASAIYVVAPHLFKDVPNMNDTSNVDSTSNPHQ
jgi:acyl-coenzyme A thioesterase PaaI-like protein